MDDSNGSSDPQRSSAQEFEAHAQQKEPGIVREFWDFLRDNKKWWLLPLVVTLLALSGLVIATSTGLAPFLYTFF